MIPRWRAHAIAAGAGVASLLATTALSGHTTKFAMFTSACSALFLAIGHEFRRKTRRRWCCHVKFEGEAEDHLAEFVGTKDGAMEHMKFFVGKYLIDHDLRCSAVGMVHEIDPEHPEQHPRQRGVERWN